jgi:hypothetical protein
MKEIAMNTSKLIELGTVSEETKGHKGEMEFGGDLTLGPPPG